MLGLIANKVAWVFLLVHAALFVVGMYQRGPGQFHWTYEPIVLMMLTIVDFFWLWLADLMQLGTCCESQRQA